MTDDDNNRNMRMKLNSAKQDSQIVHQMSGTFKYFIVDCNNDIIVKKKLTISSL